MDLNTVNNAKLDLADAEHAVKVSKRAAAITAYANAVVGDAHLADLDRILAPYGVTLDEFNETLRVAAVVYFDDQL